MLMLTIAYTMPSTLNKLVGEYAQSDAMMVVRFNLYHGYVIIVWTKCYHTASRYSYSGQHRGMTPLMGGEVVDYCGYGGNETGQEGLVPEGVRRALLASSPVGNLLMTQVGWDPCVQPISPL